MKINVKTPEIKTLNELNAGEVFKTEDNYFIKTTMGSQFVIPVYQRIYTWNPEKETARFMNDVQDLLGRYIVTRQIERGRNGGLFS